MGALTRTEIITQALNLAGDSSLDTLAVAWLNQWLKRTYAAWPWPFLQTQKTGLSLPAGSGSVSVGAGAGSVTLPVLRIYDPLFVYNTAKTTRAEARVKAYIPQRVDDNPELMQTTETGLPSRFGVRMSTSTWGQWSLYPMPFPDRDYLLTFTYQFCPADLGASDIPIYPNDDTLVQAVIATALKYIAAADSTFARRLQMEEALLREKEGLDRINFGTQDGLTETIDLYGGIFRG